MTTVTKIVLLSFKAHNQRLAVVERLFGMAFPLQLEPVVYGITDRMAEGYDGGYWDFYTLSNGGFYMAPYEDRIFHVKCQNMYEGGPLGGCPRDHGMPLCLQQRVIFPQRHCRGTCLALSLTTGVHAGPPGGESYPGGDRLSFRGLLPPPSPGQSP